MHYITSIFSYISLLCISNSKDKLPTLVVGGNVGVGIPTLDQHGTNATMSTISLTRVIQQQCIIANFSVFIVLLMYFTIRHLWFQSTLHWANLRWRGNTLRCKLM